MFGLGRIYELRLRLVRVGVGRSQLRGRLRQHLSIGVACAIWTMIFLALLLYLIPICESECNLKRIYLNDVRISINQIP